MGIVGEMQKQGKDAEAKAYLERARAEYADIPLPSYEDFVAHDMGPAALAAVQADPALKAAQQQALGMYDQIQANRGETLADQATYNKTVDQASQQARVQQANIAEQARQHGTADSGRSVALQQMAGSQAANRINESGMQEAARAQQRYFDSILNKGNLAGEMRKQQFGEDTQAAQAKDLRDTYNNNARIAAQTANNTLANQRYLDASGRVGLMSGQNVNLASLALDQGKSGKDMAAGIGAAASKWLTPAKAAKANSTPAPTEGSAPDTSAYGSLQPQPAPVSDTYYDPNTGAYQYQDQYQMGDYKQPTEDWGNA